MGTTTIGRPFEPIPLESYVCSTWFERDRRHISLQTPNGRTVFELWDEAVDEAIEDGFLRAPRVPRPSDADWQPHAVQYALDKGLIKSNDAGAAVRRN